MQRIVLFDGVCNFCNSSVNFLIARDRDDKFRFAPLQSPAGQALKERFNISDDVDSVILIEDDKAYTHSEAAIRMAKALGGVWSVCGVFGIVPAALRDPFYKLFAKHRYKLFGRKDACMMPTPEIRAKFIE
ncbi:MAG: thiol-disulfide oxidoreductase DCC family protein [Acidobacteriota bacterium]|nr:MAG: thiol-disulfide oxidoreductase DCC family protein [Acidobacteriota bacterium]